MEDVLEIPTWPDRDDVLIICMDEVSTQLHAATCEPLPLAPGSPARSDYDYERCGTATIFIGFELLRAQRFTTVTAQRTRVDWAHWMRTLVDERYPDADVIVLVIDNLTTHGLASLYEAFPPAEAKRIAMKVDIHHTPKHGSWLTMAEIEARVLRRHCLDDRRIADRDVLAAELRAWEERRNCHHATVDWRFTLDDVRIKLKRLYPSLKD